MNNNEVAKRLMWTTHKNETIPIDIMTFSHKINIIRQVINFCCNSIGIEPIPISNPVATILFGGKNLNGSNLRVYLKAFIALCEKDLQDPNAVVPSSYLAIYNKCKEKSIELMRHPRLDDLNNRLLSE